jgi:hypothetical protein
MWLHPRLEVCGPDLSWGWKVHLKPGGDEYGNCSYYLKCALFCVVVFPFPHFQRNVEIPEPGENAWVDAVRYRGFFDD